jgi:two-component system invasion response regulator UvrY
MNQLSIVEPNPASSVLAIVKPIKPVEFTSREVLMARYMCSDLSYKQIADMSGLSIRTVQYYRNMLCDKMNVKSRVGIAIYAIKFDLIKL